MKNFLFLFLGIGLIITCKNMTGTGTDADLVQNPNTLQPKDPNVKYPQMKFDTMSWHFGSIGGDTIVSHDFHFKNTGNAILVIQDAVGSCGCTIPEWPKEPIAPGESGV